MGWLLGVAALPLLAMGFGIWRMTRAARSQGLFGLAERVHQAQSAQEYLLVQGVDHGVVDLGSHEWRAIVEVAPVNFWLLSRDEQDRYQELFRVLLDAQQDPLSIFVLARRVDIREAVAAWATPAPGRSLSPALQEYAALVSQDLLALVEARALLTRGFYFVLHWRPTAKVLARQTDISKAAHQALRLRQQELIAQLGRMGLKAHPLSTAETLQLLFDVYNRDRARVMRVKDLAAAGVGTLYSTAPRYGYVTPEADASESRG